MLTIYQYDLNYLLNNSFDNCLLIEVSLAVIG